MPLVLSIRAKVTSVLFGVFLATLSCSFSGVASGQTNTTTMNGTLQATTVTTGNLNNQAQVDGVTNPSLAATVGSPQCFGDGNSPQGCVVWDGLPELLQAWPLLGSHTYRIGLGKGSQGSAVNGIFYTRVPLTLATSQMLIGSGRTRAGDPEDGTTGTVIRACDGNGDTGDSYCTFNSNPVYFPNAPPTPLNNDTMGTAWQGLGSGGSLTPGTYHGRVSWVVNLATGCDTQTSNSWPLWSTLPSSPNKVYAGTCIYDTVNTEMAVNEGIKGGSPPPSWNSTVGGRTSDAGITWVNLGNSSNTYGTPGISLPSPEVNITVPGATPQGKITLNIPSGSVGDYPTCESFDGSSISNGTYVRGPRSNNTHTYRAIGSGSISHTLSCLMPTTSGVQTADGNNPVDCPNPASGTCLYWQEVGNTTANYLPVVGFIPFVSLDSGKETAFGGQDPTATDTCGGGSNIVQVGALTVCKITATFTLKSADNFGHGTHPPVVDTTHPLIVLGERQNQVSTSLSSFMSRAQDLTADANNIAGEACAYIYGQEQSGCYGVNAVSGTEASIAAVGPGSQNAMIYDFVASNPSNPSGPYHLPRLGGIYIDSRDGGAMKTVLHGTITPYNNPGGSSVPAGLSYVGKDDITIESVHTENVTDGIYCNGDSVLNLNANCFILSTDPAAASGAETNTVHLGSMVKTAFVNTIKGASQAALEDDTTPGGATAYTADGTYVLGLRDGTSNHLRIRLVPQPSVTQWLDGPLLLSNASGSSPVAGSAVFAPGNDVTGLPTAIQTATIEGPPTVSSSYRLTLPGGANSGILQGSNPVSTPDLVTGTFSGDTAHSKQNLVNIGAVPTQTFSCCDVAGLYHVHWSFVQSTPCTSVGAVTFLLSWTDNNGIPHNSQQMPMFEGSSLTVPGGVFHLQTGSLTSAWASGDFNMYKNASSQIQYQTGYTASCGSFPNDGRYDLLVTVTQLQ